MKAFLKIAKKLLQFKRWGSCNLISARISVISHIVHGEKCFYISSGTSICRRYAKSLCELFHKKVQGPWICFEIGMQFSQPFLLVDCTSSLQQMPTFVSSENLLKFFYLWKSIKYLWWMNCAIMQILIKGAKNGFAITKSPQKRVVFKNCIFHPFLLTSPFLHLFAKWEGIHFYVPQNQTKFLQYFRH